MDNQKLVKIILINYKLLKQYPYTCTTTAIVTNNLVLDILIVTA